MKNQIMVWLAAANLHDQGKAPFQRRELLAEIICLFPQANHNTIVSYVDNHTNVSGSLPYSFGYLIRTAPKSYCLTKTDEENPLGKPRWPNQSEVPPEFLGLWQRWSAWQRPARPEDPTSLQILLERHLIALIPPPAAVERDGQAITVQRGDEIVARVEPEFFWMRTTRTRWDSQSPIAALDGELSLSMVDRAERSPEATALAIIAAVQSVFGPRIGSYVRCSDCGRFYPPEAMTGAWCHGCASSNHQVVY